jgi:hypothetical protein
MQAARDFSASHDGKNCWKAEAIGSEMKGRRSLEAV